MKTGGFKYFLFARLSWFLNSGGLICENPLFVDPLEKDVELQNSELYW